MDSGTSSADVADSVTTGILALAQGDVVWNRCRACNELRRTLSEIGVSLGQDFVELEHQILNGAMTEDIDNR